MDKRRLGANGPLVSALGLGCMGMSEFYGSHDRAESISTIAAALEAGITLFDTGDFYGMGHNEMLLAEALQGHREQAFIQVKFGAQRAPDGSFVGVNASSAATKTALAYSLRRLGTDYVDLYQTGSDPSVPVEETIGTIGDLVRQGYVRHVGITNVDTDTLRRAHATHPIAALQFEYGLLSRDIESELLPVCRELGIAVTAYGVLGRGLLTGSKGNGDGDLRATYYPRFQDENLTHNAKLADTLRQVAEGEGLTAAQAAIAWVVSQGDDIIPLIGASTRARLAEAINAPLRLSAASLSSMAGAVPPEAVRGSRNMMGAG
ncbi:aldo/keto reductase [Aureimonas altamirensis]|uniref:aldo/keto reductase n=1 Tax=Aureimonas altamirensis TaxID=370622 RepID=UPI001E4EE5E9|nr:aldo/keto reductase [Aureimonas altamirensis]UHD45802.1 aldo/keto reductase [Aureimonas altamirensis]